MPSNHLILCCLLLLPSIFLSIRVFAWGGQSWSFSFIISPPNEYSGLISFRTDWFDLLTVQGTLQESSLAPQFENINFSMLSLFYGPILISVHDYRKNQEKPRLFGEISITSDTQMIPPHGRKWRTEEPLDESERGEWKSWLKAQHSEN